MEASNIRRSAFALLAVLTIVVAFTAERMAQPEPAQACPVCVVAGGVGLYEIVATGLAASAIAGGTAIAVNKIQSSADRARAVARHPGRHSRFLHKMRQYRTLGKAIWRHVHRSLRGLRRFVVARVSIHHIKRKLPGAAWACGVMGITSYLMNGKPKEAMKACIAAGTSVLFIGAKSKATERYAGDGEWLVRQYRAATDG
jgi:hypothetical protein